MEENNTLAHEFNQIILQDLVGGSPPKQILEHVRQHMGMDIFILDQDSRPILYTASQPLSDYFPNIYESGDDIICFTSPSESLFFSKQLQNKEEITCVLPQAGERFCTVLYTIHQAERPDWVLVLKFDRAELLIFAKEAAPVLSLLCKSQLCEKTEKPSARPNGMDAAIARELLLYDSSTARRIPENQFKLQNEALLNSKKMEDFRAPYAIAAFKFRKQQNGDFLTALSELEYHFPNSFPLVIRDTMYALFFNCLDDQWDELKNFAYQMQLYAGVSDFFNCLDDRSFFKQQAKELLRIGMQITPQKYLFLYFDYYTELLLLNASDRFGIPVLILSDVRKLAKLDEDNGTSYLDTLEQYLRCCNSPTAAAKAMFIDRGTLHYRLQKITDILNIDFENPAYSQSLSASIRLFHLSKSFT